MSSRVIKLASAVVLAAPLVFVFSPHSANAYDCDQKYGGGASHPTCNDVGFPLRVQDGKPYRVTGSTDISGNTIALCNGAVFDSTTFRFTGTETADTAESVVQTGGELIAGLGDHVGRNIGYLVQYAGSNSHTITVNCVDDHAPFTH
jgi:hypothetical protein